MNPTDLPRISEAESSVMQALWQRHPQTAEELCVELGALRGWQPATVKTLLARLVKKGVLATEAEGRRFRYTPLLQQEAWVHHESVGLLERLFDGRVAPFVAHFSRHRKLSKKERAELQRIIDEMEP